MVSAWPPRLPTALGSGDDRGSGISAEVVQLGRSPGGDKGDDLRVAESVFDDAGVDHG
jgi:hypothetical protein